MSIEDIIHAWKNEEDALDPRLPANPIGQELSEEELLAITGGTIVNCTFTCDSDTTCDADTCGFTCRSATPPAA